MAQPVVADVWEDSQRSIVTGRWDDSDLPGAVAGSVDAGSVRFSDFHDHYMA